MSQNARARVSPPGPARRWPGSRWPGSRAADLTAAVAGIALVASACGGEGSSTGGSAASGSVPDAQQRATACSQCMQSYGDPGFPDPQQRPGGAWLYAETPQTRQYFSGPGFDEAQRACRKLQPDQGITPAEREAAIDQFLQIARCMRAHGIPDFPDPTTSNGGIGISLSGLDPNSPQFPAAQKACHTPGF